MLQSPYRKEWYVSTSIAKGFIGMQVGERISTITEYAEQFACSRGIVQNALSLLEEEKAVVLHKQGKMGTFLAEKNEEVLFRYSGLNNLTASMPPPINQHFAGLATGICSGIAHCPVPFTFAFVQGSENRVNALLSGAYDFAVTTRCSAEVYAAAHPELEIAFPFENCEYSLPYRLYINRPGMTGLLPGMTVAMDPTSLDHRIVTQMACAGKQVKIREMSFLSGIYAFYMGEIDDIVFRNGFEASTGDLLKLAMKDKNGISHDQISELPLDEVNRDMQLPVVLVHRDNYGMVGILKKYLAGDVVGAIQRQVLNGSMVPRFY